MDEWQLEHICKKKPELIVNINCTTEIMAILESTGMLSKSDVDILETCVKSGDGKHKQSAKLLEILETREKGYGRLINALHQTCQTGAREILLEGYQANNKTTPILSTFGTYLFPQELLDQKVEFQGQKRTLEKVCSNFSEKDLNAIIKNSLDEDSWKELISSKLKLVEDTIPPELPYYISRSLSIQNIIEKDAFRMLDQDVFVIENMELSQLTKLAMDSFADDDDFPTEAEESTHNKQKRKYLTGISSKITKNQTKKDIPRFIHLEAPHHYSKISSLSSNPVHWLQFKDNKYVLITSSKGLENISKYVSPLQQTFTQKDFIKFTIGSYAPAVFCISDSPGMGKTVLLADIARNIRATFPDRVVLCISLPQFVQRCQDLGTLEYMEIKEVLVSLASKNSFGQNIVRKLMSSSSHQTELLFDAFDEILPGLIETANQVLKTIVKESKCTRVFVSTRPHMRAEVEKTLCTYAYHIQPFQHAEQRDFLVRYWQNYCSKPVNKDYLNKLAEFCLSHLKVRDQERKITGIPLICKLLAEVFLMDEDSKLDAGVEFGTEEIIIDPVQTIFEMYKRHMNSSFQKVDESEREKAFSIHIRESMKVLFPGLVSSDNVQIPNDVFKIGLMETSLIAPYRQFVHRTFAEYLAAFFLVECIKCPDYFQAHFWITAENEVGLVFKTVLDTVPNLYFIGEVSLWDIKVPDIRSFSNPVVAYFFNEHLNSQNISSHFQQCFENTIWNSPLKFWEEAGCAISDDYHSVYTFLNEIYLSSSADDNLERFRLPELPWTTLLLIGALYSSRELFGDCCELVESIEKKQVENMEFSHIFTEPELHTPLHVSIRRGNYQIFEDLFASYKHKLSTLKGLLHSCVQMSSHQSSQVIDNKIQIIEVLLSQHKACLGEKAEDDRNRTPLLMVGIHTRLLQHLILERADVFAVDNHMKAKVADIATTYMTPGEYHDFVSFLIVKKKTSIFFSKDAEECSSVHKLVHELGVNADTLNLLSKMANVTFNNENMDGDTEFFYAIKGYRCQKVLKCMIQLGANMKRKNKQREGPLHSASKWDNVEATRLLLSLGSDPNDTDEKGYTPLHWVAFYGFDNAKQIAKLLLEKGAQVNAINLEKKTPLQLALEKSVRVYPSDLAYTPNLVQLLREYGGKSAEEGELS